MNSQTGISLQGVSFSYNQEKVVDGVSFSLAQGQRLSLLGPSGCGKSTLLRLISGLIKPSSGQIWLDQVQVAAEGVHVPPEKRDVALMFQEYALFPHMTALENILFAMKAGRSRSQTQRAMDWLSSVNLSHLAQISPTKFSGGQKQRLALARALAQQPRLLLLDEPFSGIDAPLRHEVRQDTLRLLHENQITSILVTHDAEEARLFGQNVAVIHDGKLEQFGPHPELLNEPSSLYVARLFGRVEPVLDPKGEAITRAQLELSWGKLGQTPHGAARGDENKTFAYLRPSALIPEEFGSFAATRYQIRINCRTLQVERCGGGYRLLLESAPAVGAPPLRFLCELPHWAKSGDIESPSPECTDSSFRGWLLDPNELLFF